MAIKDTFAVAAATISDSSGNIVFAASQKLSNLDVLQGEATAALLATRLAIFSGCDRFHLEGDALLVTLAINNPFLFESWNFASIVSDIRLNLSSF